MNKNNFSHVSENIFFPNKKYLVLSVSVYPLAAPFGAFTFYDSTFTDHFYSWTVHVSSFCLERSTEYLTVQTVAVQVKGGKAIATELLILFGQNSVK